MFRFVSKQFCLFRLFRYSFETPKQTEKNLFWFHETNRNKRETDLVSVCFGSNRNIFFFVSRTPYPPLLKCSYVTESVFVNVYGAQESISPAYVACRAGTKNRVVVPAHQDGNRFLGSLKGLQIRALAQLCCAFCGGGGSFM